MTLNSGSSVSYALDDADQIWGSDDEVTMREWSKMDGDFTNAGYREGITAGKESALQEGFDDGFDNIGAPLGREVGILRGAATAVLSFFSQTQSRWRSRPEDVARWQDEFRGIIHDLERIHLADLAPRDLQAEEHAKEHLESHASEKIHTTMEQGVNGIRTVEHRLKSSNSDPPPSLPAVEKLQRLRLRILEVLKELELEISLT